MNALAISASCLLLAAGSALAQQTNEAPKPPQPAPSATQPHEIDPAAQRLLDAHKAANAKLVDLSYDVKQAFSADEAALGGNAHVSLIIEHDEEGMPFKAFHIQLRDESGKTHEEWACDGEQLQKVDVAGKKLLTLEDEDAPLTPPMTAFQFFPQWVFEEAGMGPETTLVGAKLLPDAVIDGVNCHAFEIIDEFTVPDFAELRDDEAAPDQAGAKPAPTMVITTSRWIGADDNLLRKLNISYKLRGGDDTALPESSITSEYSSLKFNQDLKPAGYLIKLPEGFTAEKADAEQMGLNEEPMDTPELAFDAGDQAPAFALKDAAGTEVTLASLKGRVVLLDFWATWCGPCKAAMPSVQKLHEQFKDKPVSIIGVNVWERGDNADKVGPEYMKQKNFSYPCLLKGDELAKTYGISGIPTLVLIDADGKVLKITVGFDPAEEEALAALIEEQLQKK